MRRKQPVFVWTAVALSAILAAAVLATPGSGIVSGAIVARASFLDDVDIKFKVDHGSQEITQVRDARDTVMQKIVIAAGGTTGWHSHHGPAVALVTRGALTLYSSDDPSCAGRLYSAGAGFIDPGQGHVHLGRNESGTETEVWVTYFDVPPGQSVRVDAADPGNCSF
ncbi:MAG TPA: hypothetical protein VM779_12685 [Thermoanaerobaculia bacterium]|nr:hypothetical protein [Thermoanaerobaculia bacterium]